MANFKIRDFDNVVLNNTKKFSEIFNDARGKKDFYDIFLSHSSKDKDLIKKIRQKLEDDLELSVYIDWEEDSGTKRDDIADTVKKAMEISNSFLIVKTSNSDESSWVSWETGFYDNKNSNAIGVLLIEDDKLTSETFKHQEYLKNYKLLDPKDLKQFAKGGWSFVDKDKENYFSKTDASKPWG